MSTAPRPFILQFTQFWWEAAAEGRLVIQRCTACATLRHPPAPACAACLCFDWDAVTASGRATVHSFTVSHHPQHPSFDYPLVIALVTLEEGTRLVVSCDIPRERISIGMPVQVGFRTDENGTPLATITERTEEKR